MLYKRYLVSKGVNKLKLKKLIPIIFSFVMCLIISLPVSVAAEGEDGYDFGGMHNDIIDNYNHIDERANITDQKINDLDKKVDEMDPEKAIKDYFDEVKEDDKPDEPAEDKYKLQTGSIAKKILAIPKSMSHVANYLMDSIKGMIIVADPMAQTYVNESIEGSPLQYGVKISDLNNESTALGKLIGVMRIFAYSLVLLFFSVNLIEQTIKYEIFTAKGMVRILGRLLLAKIIIDMSAKICILIISVIGKLTLQMLDKIQITLNIYPDITMDKSGVKVIGPILDAIAAAFMSLILMLVMGVVLVCVSLVMIKLCLRSIELAMLIVVSPAFFACLSTDVTKEYFKRFLQVFLQVATQTLFMAIAMAVCSGSLNSDPIKIEKMSELALALIRVTPTVLITISMCIVMIKPPKVLTGLLK